MDLYLAPGAFQRRQIVLDGTEFKQTALLVDGGKNSADIYDPSTQQFSPIGSLNLARQSHTATLLPDGTVAVIGGSNPDRFITQSVEIFDPESGMSRDAFETSGFFSGYAAFPRPDGTTALIGAFGAEIINLETGFTRTAATFVDLPQNGPIVALQDGRILLIGGSTFDAFDDAGSTSSGSTTLVDLDAGTAAEGPPLNTPRGDPVSVTLLDGTVLVFGGINFQANVFVEIATAVE